MLCTAFYVSKFSALKWKSIAMGDIPSMNLNMQPKSDNVSPSHNTEMGADNRHPSFLRDSSERHDTSDHIEEELKHARLSYGEFAKVVGERASRGVCFTQRHFTLLVWTAKSI